MDAETLERLLMDRALGGLAPDVDALLAAYLEHDAGAAQREREFATAVQTAQEALRETAPVALPPFPAARIRGLEHARRRLVLVRNVAGIAAVLVLGIGLGAGFGGRYGAEHINAASTGTTVLSGAVAVAGTESELPGTGEFWSARRLYEQAHSEKHGDAVRVIWDSPVSSPRLETRS